MSIRQERWICNQDAALRCGLMLSMLLASAMAAAQTPIPGQPRRDPGTHASGKLLMTGGVSQVEGTGGGGLTPWATIGGYDTRDQVGASAFVTRVLLDDYRIDSYGALIGIRNRLELSIARQRFDTRDVGTALGLGRGFAITQDTIGAKLRLFGEAVLEQDHALPQVSLGVQRKRNNRGALLQAIGARGDSGTDVYLSASKLLLAQDLMLSATLRYTRANQFGILGFGGDRHSGYQPQLEASAAYLLRRQFAIGAEYRQKPDNLRLAHEDDAWDAFVAWAPNKHLAVTLAYVDLGTIVIPGSQRGVYASLQVGF